MFLSQKWDRLLERSPDRVLLVDRSREQWTVRALDELARAWSDKLKSVPRIAGRLIGFCLPNGPDWIGLFVAILRAQSVAMPFDPGTPRGNACDMVKSLGGRAYIDGSDLQSWPISGRKLPADICLAKITSGSTRRPGRFCFSHAEMDADGRQIESGMGIRPDDANFAVIPFGHSYGLGNLIMPMLRSGIPIVLGRSILPREVLVDLIATSATVFPAVPTIIHALTTADLPNSLRSIGCRYGPWTFGWDPFTRSRGAMLADRPDSCHQ